MFKGFSSRQNLNGVPKLGPFGSAFFSAYGFNGCKVWLDAGNGHPLIGGSNIESWTNLIDGNRFSQQTVAARPLFEASHIDFNSNPALYFDAGDQLTSGRNYVFDGGNFGGAFFCVIQRNGNVGTTESAIFHPGGGNAVGVFTLGNQTTRGIQIRGVVNSGVDDFNPHIIAAKYGSSGGLWVDGIKYPASFTQFQFYNAIGWSLGGNGMNAWLGELLFYDSIFSDSEILDVSTQLNAKYAIY